MSTKCLHFIQDYHGGWLLKIHLINTRQHRPINCVEVLGNSLILVVVEEWLLKIHPINIRQHTRGVVKLRWVKQASSDQDHGGSGKY